jgi:hypothetical protein
MFLLLFVLWMFVGAIIFAFSANSRGYQPDQIPMTFKWGIFAALAGPVSWLVFLISFVCYKQGIIRLSYKKFIEWVDS